MNRRFLTLSVVLIVIFFLFRFCNSNKKDQPAEEKSAPLTFSENSGTFNQSFTKLLNSYYTLKNAFVEGDSVAVNTASIQLNSDASGLAINDIQGDTTGTIRETATSFVSVITSSGTAMVAEKTIDDKRKEFNVISDALWSLTRTVRYDAQKVYYQYCPMAFDNSGAYWLSDKREISNPYFGSKMPRCGEVTDSLDYSKR